MLHTSELSEKEKAITNVLNVIFIMCSLEGTQKQAWKTLDELYEQVKIVLGDNAFSYDELKQILELDETLSIGAFIIKQRGKGTIEEITASAVKKYRLSYFFGE